MRISERHCQENVVLAAEEERENKFTSKYLRAREDLHPAKRARVPLPSPCIACCSHPTR